MRKRKVLVMSPVYQGFGGAEFMVMNLAEHYMNSGVDVKVVIEDSGHLKPLKVRCSECGISIRFAKLGDGIQKGIRRVVSLFWQTLVTVWVFIQEKPDAVHIILPGHPQGLHMLLACKLTGTPANINFVLVAEEDKHLVSERKARIYRWIKKPRQIWTALSKNNARILEEAFRLKEGDVRVVHNGYMLNHDMKEADKPIREELGISHNTKILITTGRLAKQKGHRFIIDIMPKLVKEFPDVLFLWVGEGQDKDELVEKLKAEDVQKYVKFTGFRSDILDLLNASDLFVFPTEFEGGAPFSLHEAIIVGCPVIASDASGIPEIMQHEKHGLLFRKGDSEDLYCNLRFALLNMNRMKKYAETAQKEIPEKFSSEVMYGKYDSILNELMNKKESHE